MYTIICVLSLTNDIRHDRLHRNLCFLSLQIVTMLSAIVFITLIASFVHGQTHLELPKLPYAYNEIEPVLSERTMRLHHDGHYYGYINKTNAAMKALFEETAKESTAWREIVKLPIEMILTRLNELPAFYNDALRHQGGGYWNHKLYFSILRKPVAKADDNRPTGPLLDAIVKSFSSYEKFQQYFTEASMGVFGSGWVWLYIDAKTGQLVLNYTAYQDNP